MRWKWVIGIAALVIVALMVAAYAVISSYDFNQLKPRIAQAARDMTGRELTLGGDMELKIGLKPTLVVDDVSFENAPWGSRPEVVRIKHLEVQVSLLPLMRGHIEVKRLILVEPDILLETDRSGKSNLAFETDEEAQPARPREREPHQKAVVLPGMVFNEVRIERGHLTYRDGRSGRTYAVALDHLSAAATSIHDPIRLALRGSYNEKPFEIGGNVGALDALSDTQKEWPLALEARVGGAHLKVDGTIKDPLQGRGIALALIAEGPSIPEVVKLAGLAGVPDVGPFKAAVRVTDPHGKLTVERLDVDVGNEDLARVKLTGVVRDPLEKRGIEIRFDARGKDVANLKRLTGQPLPLKGAFSVAGRVVDLASRTYQISDLQVTLGDSDLSGSMEVNLGGERPQLTAVLSSERLDLRPLLAEEDSTPKEDTGAKRRKPPRSRAKRERVFPNEPLPMDALGRADARVKIQAGQIFLKRLALKGVTVEMVLQEGHLTIQPLKATIGGGSLDGRIDLRPQEEAAVLDAVLDVDRMDAGRMLQDLELTDIVEGVLDMDIHIEGRGDSIAALMAGLNGRTSAVMGRGRIHNKYLDLLGADLSSSVLRLLNPNSQEAGYTEFNCFVSRFDIVDGLADSTALVFDTKDMSVVGDGEVNLRTERLNLSLKPSPKKGVGTTGIGKVSMGLGGLANPFKLGGTLAHPSLALDETQAAITLGKAVGGTLLFGPVGVAAALVSAGRDDENPCLEAIAAAEEGVRVVDSEGPEEEKGTVERATKSVTGGVKGAVKGIGKTFKKLFGKE